MFIINYSPIVPFQGHDYYCRLHCRDNWKVAQILYVRLTKLKHNFFIVLTFVFFEDTVSQILLSGSGYNLT